jgi:hypothetical protein
MQGAFGREQVKRRELDARSFAMYGETTGETDEYGLPVRYNWAAEYRGRDERIKAAHTAEELAAAIRSMHEALTRHADAWAELVEVTRHWR